MSKRYRWRLFIGGAILIGAAGAAWAVGTAAADPNVAIVRALAVDTLTLEHRMGVPDPSINGPVTAAAADQLRANADAAAKSHYRGPLLTTRMEQLQAAVDDEINGRSSVIDGGAKDVVFTDTTVDRTTATVHLKATTWAKVSQNGVVANPISTDNWTFEFEKVDGQWYVVNVDTDFHG